MGFSKQFYISSPEANGGELSVAYWVHSLMVTIFQYIRVHPVSRYAKYSEKYLLVFRKILHTDLMDNPLLNKYTKNQIVYSRQFSLSSWSFMFASAAYCQCNNQGNDQLQRSHFHEKILWCLRMQIVKNYMYAGRND